MRIDLQGMNSLFGDKEGTAYPEEVRLRLAVRTESEELARDAAHEVELLYFGPAGGGGVVTSVVPALGVDAGVRPARAGHPRDRGRDVVKLREIAYSRSGDKGDVSNICVFVDDPADYPLLVERLTADRVRAHFGGLVEGDVVRYELPNVHGLNFVLDRALGGGVSMTLRVDPHGKSFQSHVARHGGLRCARSRASAATVFVDGRWSSGNGHEYASVDPSTARPVATWHLADVAQADAGVAAARRSVRRLEPHANRGSERQCCAGSPTCWSKHHEELAQLVTTEVGSPISLARTLQTATPVTNLRWAADIAEPDRAVATAERLPALEGPPRVESELLRVPIGVVAAVTPYNYPVNMIAWKVGPALAAGCAAVLLPSPRGALCSVAVVRLAEEAGVPPGVLNLVPGGPDVGQRLSAHPDVDLVSFTGSNAIGAAVAEAAARCTPRSSSSSAASRRPWSCRAQTSRGPSGRRCCGSVATPVRAVAPRRGSSCTAASTTSSSTRRSCSCASGCRWATPETRRPRSVR